MVHQQKIIPIYSFAEVEKSLECIDQKTLVIFDIDSTLIVPKSPLLHPQAFSSYKGVLKSVYEMLTPEQKHFFNHSLIAHPSMVVEPLIVEIIKKLQARKVPTMAMTTAKPGRFDGQKREFQEVRNEQLQDVGIDFSFSSYPDTTFFSMKATCGDFPRLQKGVVYCCGLHNTKGILLEAFLNEVFKGEVEKIIFFDDKQKHVESIASMLKEKFPYVECIGYLYKGADCLKAEVAVTKEEFTAYLLSLMAKVKQLDMNLQPFMQMS